MIYPYFGRGSKAEDQEVRIVKLACKTVVLQSLTVTFLTLALLLGVAR
jgi:hypothetical protein